MTTKAEQSVLRHGGDTCRQAREDIMAAWSKLKGHIDANRNRWKGVASAAFTNAEAAVEADLNTIMGRLSAIENGIGRTSVHLAEVDAEAKRSLDSAIGSESGSGTGSTAGGGSVDVRAGLS